MPFDVRKIFTLNAMIRRLRALPALRTPVMDEVFTDRPNHPMPILSDEMISETLETLPLVRRGAPSIAATQSSTALNWYEPLPIRPNVRVSGVELNNLKVMGASNIDQWASMKTDSLRRSVRRTTEAIAAIVVDTGSITWPVKMETGGWDSYTVDFGTPLSVTPDKLFDDAGAKVKDVFNVIQEMEEAVQDEGFGSSYIIWAGKTAYSTILGIVEDYKSTARMTVSVSDMGIDVGGYTIRRRSERNKNPETGAMVPTVPDKDMVFIATDAGHRLPYCAIDDLDGNLNATPLFVKPVPTPDPSGYKLIGESKPFPVVNVKGICKATVIS